MILVLDSEYKKHIEDAAAVIKNGGVVAFPTETVYGLGANAYDESAVAKIFELKGRPQDNPLIVHVESLPAAKSIAAFGENAERLARRFWPGPLTLVLENKGIPSIVTAGLGTVAVRMPDSDAALSLISASGVPIAAPSANKSGSPSPTCARHVQNDFGDSLLILDAGECGIGVESTVVDVTGEVPVILRPGAVTAEMIAQEAGSAEISSAAPGGTPPSPGMKYRHYAPRADVTVVEGDRAAVIEAIKFLYDKALKNGDKPLVMACRENRKHYGKRDVFVTGSETDPREAAKNLYSLLRSADENGYTGIFFEAVKKEGIGFAVMNRVYKAASYNVIRVTDKR